MGYLIAQIFLLLLLAAAIGFGIAWLLQATRHARQILTLESEAAASRQACEKCQSKLAALEAGLAALQRASSERIDAIPDVTSIAPAALVDGARPPALRAPRGRADDLKMISGVGVKLEKTLNGLGIYHFNQVASWTRENVGWINEHLRFKGRIEREKWIEQAAALANGESTEFSRRYVAARDDT